MSLEKEYRKDLFLNCSSSKKNYLERKKSPGKIYLNKTGPEKIYFYNRISPEKIHLYSNINPGKKYPSLAEDQFRKDLWQQQEQSQKDLSPA